MRRFLPSRTSSFLPIATVSSTTSRFYSFSNSFIRRPPKTSSRWSSQSQIIKTGNSLKCCDYFSSSAASPVMSTSTQSSSSSSSSPAPPPSSPPQQDPTSMKVSDIKAEIEALGAKDKLFQGMEKSDLVDILINARKNSSPASGGGSSSSPSLADLVKSTFGPNAERRSNSLRYGEVLLVGNTRNPSALVTFCHGLGDTCHGWAQGMETEVADALPHVLFLLPTAPTQPVSMNMGYAMPAWYDIKGLGERSSEDPEGVAISCQYLEKKAKEACEKFNIKRSGSNGGASSSSCSRVVFAGFSQGAALSLALGLTSRDIKPAGIACLSGYLAARDFVLPNIVNGDVPIQQFHGTADPMVNLALAQKSKETLQETGKVTNLADIKTYRGMQHSSCPQEMMDFVQFVKQVVPAI